MILALARHIFEHGVEERFYSKVFKYHHEGGKVYWCMDPTPESTDLINRCDEDQTYEARLAAGTLPNPAGSRSRQTGPAPIVGSGVNGDLLHEGKLDLPEVGELPTPEDLAWAREFISQRRWQEVVTYRGTAPHDYTVRQWRRGEAAYADFDRFAILIRHCGYADLFCHIRPHLLGLDEQKVLDHGVARRGSYRDQPGAAGRIGRMESHGRESAMSKQKELERWAAKGRPLSCPSCGSPRISRILYGLPDFSEELQEVLSQGTVTLGGCVVTGDDPEWECLQCGQTILASTKRRDWGRSLNDEQRVPSELLNIGAAEGQTSRGDAKISEFWRSKVARAGHY